MSRGEDNFFYKNNTQNRQALARQENERQYHEMVEALQRTKRLPVHFYDNSLNDAMLVGYTITVAKTGKFLYANAHFCRILGYTKHEVAWKKHWCDIVTNHVHGVFRTESFRKFGQTPAVGMDYLTREGKVLSAQSIVYLSPNLSHIDDQGQCVYLPATEGLFHSVHWFAGPESVHLQALGDDIGDDIFEVDSPPAEIVEFSPQLELDLM